MSIKQIISFFAPEPPRALDEQELPEHRQVRMKMLRLQVFLSATFGYGFYYVCRLSLNVIKKPLIDHHILTETQLGIVGSALFFSYAVGKFVNGFLVDRSNIRRFMALGLFVSAIINLSMGFIDSFVLFVVLWGVNGWFQSMGAPPAIVSMSRWFNNKERGTYYGFFSASHNIGEAFTYIFTALLVSYAGWQWGFVGAFIAGILGVIIVLLWLHDSPEAKGLPPVMVSATKKDIGKLQLEVLKTPAIWILAISSSLMYVSRYAITSWGMLFLQEHRGYGAVHASFIISISSISGIFGNIFSGWVSDKFFNSSRNIPAFIFGVLNTLSIALFLLIPIGYEWVEYIAMVVFGFSIGVLICYLAGLMAVDIVPKRVSGAAIGVVGVASYIGAGLQDIVSGMLIESGKTVQGNVVNYNFAPVLFFWIGAALLSVILCLLIWNVKPKEE
ncbi:MFS transporter [Pedobacter sp. BS3]|uniref:MFS transporter n=1 Tax=Pedobacter sp. BS3 TaxID=2567937 RepID=UPI0011EDEFDF|nr:MFS transporter [Pedobacter sp. BS3]TZF84901.1 MFS transporter [Pedobacter sp. BS3]